MISNIFLSLLCLSFNLNQIPVISLPRRDFLTSSNFAFSILRNKNIDVDKIDYYAHWSIYGLIPPPIEKTITYEQLINEVKNNNIIKIQQSPQHDCVVATTNIGHRWACLIKDKDINIRNKEIKEINSNLKILPIEKKYVIIRNIWQTWLATYSSLFFLSELGIIDIDLIGYSSILEKENMVKNGKKRKRLLSFLSNKNETKNN